MLEGIEPLPKAGSRAEDLVRRLEALIVARGPESGARLGSKDEIRQTFQVAHGTINEAVRVLETRGLVELRRGPQGGVFVAPRSLKLQLSQVILGLRKSAVTVENCLVIRNQLEALTMVEAAKVAPHKPDAVAELYRLLEKMGATLDNPAESLRWNWLLHRRIAEMGENAVLTSIYVSLLDFLEQEVTEVAPAKSYKYAKRILSMHYDLVNAIRSGDPSRAVEAAKNHPLPIETADGDAAAGSAQPFHKARPGDE